MLHKDIKTPTASTLTTNSSKKDKKPEPRLFNHSLPDYCLTLSGRCLANFLLVRFLSVSTVLYICFTKLLFLCAQDHLFPCLVMHAYSPKINHSIHSLSYSVNIFGLNLERCVLHIDPPLCYVTYKESEEKL